MKVTTTKTEPSFVPFTLNITFESMEEAAKFYAIFNYAYIADALAGYVDYNNVAYTTW